jgi:hypothetical protein
VNAAAHNRRIWAILAFPLRLIDPTGMPGGKPKEIYYDSYRWRFNDDSGHFRNGFPIAYPVEHGSIPVSLQMNCNWHADGPLHSQ